LDLRPPGPLPRPMLGPFERRQPTVGFLHRNDEFVAKGSSFRLRLRPDLPRIPACLTPYVSLDFSGRRE
jgi:hypothetical protein